MDVDISTNGVPIEQCSDDQMLLDNEEVFDEDGESVVQTPLQRVEQHSSTSSDALPTEATGGLPDNVED